MPEIAKPRPPEVHPEFVHTAGKQEDHFSAAAELAAKLGWKGNDDWVANDIAVVDARNYLAKVLHEHFIHAAKGEELPDHAAACEHLGLTDEGERALVAAALKTAHEAGKGAELTKHKVIAKAFSAVPMTADGFDALGKLSAAASAGKVG